MRCVYSIGHAPFLLYTIHITKSYVSCQHLSRGVVNAHHLHPRIYILNILNRKVRHQYPRSSNKALPMGTSSKIGTVLIQLNQITPFQIPPPLPEIIQNCRLEIIIGMNFQGIIHALTELLNVAQFLCFQSPIQCQNTVRLSKNLSKQCIYIPIIGGKQLVDSLIRKRLYNAECCVIDIIQLLVA